MGSATATLTTTPARRNPTPAIRRWTPHAPSAAFSSGGLGDSRGTRGSLTVCRQTGGDTSSRVCTGSPLPEVFLTASVTAADRPAVHQRFRLAARQRDGVADL